ncbi:MAG: hypothetical protein AAGJ35_01050, partial [Myxococcota bacterium]
AHHSAVNPMHALPSSPKNPPIHTPQAAQSTAQRTKDNSKTTNTHPIPKVIQNPSNIIPELTDQSDIETTTSSDNLLSDIQQRQENPSAKQGQQQNARSKIGLDKISQASLETLSRYSLQDIHELSLQDIQEIRELSLDGLLAAPQLTPPPLPTKHSPEELRTHPLEEIEQHTPAHTDKTDNIQEQAHNPKMKPQESPNLQLKEAQTQEKDARKEEDQFTHDSTVRVQISDVMPATPEHLHKHFHPVSTTLWRSFQVTSQQLPFSAEKLLQEKSLFGTSSNTPFLAFLCSDHQKELFLHHTPHFFLQLHRMTTYPLLVAQLAVLENETREKTFLYCTFLLQSPHSEAFFQALQDKQLLKIYLCDNELQPFQQIHCEQPFKRNTQYLLKEANRWKKQLPSQSLNLEQAQVQFLEETYERQGKMRHNFSASSFDGELLPAETFLAVSIVDYWSSADQLDYLVATKSFPLEDFQNIQRRVCSAALNQGIALPRNLFSCALAQKFADTPQALCKNLLSSFVETNLQLHHKNDLDPAENLENWQQLIDLCEQYDVSIDPEIEELALHAEKRAQLSIRETPSLQSIADLEVIQALDPKSDG